MDRPQGDVAGQCAPGTRPLPRWVAPAGTHLIGVADAIELGRVLGRLPSRVVVYGIEGVTFALGAPMSAPVSDVLASVARRVGDEVARLR